MQVGEVRQEGITLSLFSVAGKISLLNPGFTSLSAYRGLFERGRYGRMGGRALDLADVKA